MENPKQDVYEIVNEKIIALLEDGIIPWRMHWIDSGLPRNLLTKKPYRGVNVMLLNTLGYPQNYFLTFNEVKAAGGSVRKNEKSQVVVYWKRMDEQCTELRYTRVFNIAQCTGLPKDLIVPHQWEPDPIACCEHIVEYMPNKPTIQHWENRAFYNAEYDIVNVPDYAYFMDAEAYYATLFPELIHSTGHEDRLSRKELAELSKFGTDPYATELLIAEIGGWHLQSEAGISYDGSANPAAAVAGWLNKLRKDKRCIIHASELAQEAIDYIFGKNVDDVEQSVQFQTATA